MKYFLNNKFGRDSVLNGLEASLVAGRIDRRTFLKLSLVAGAASHGLMANADALDAGRANQARLVASLTDQYDYIVCGAGSSGCVVARRLAENPNVRVLLIEAGDWDNVPDILDPGKWFTNLGTSRDWGDIAIPSPSVNGRAIAEHMGKAVGGGSSINATIWVRGHKNDYDFWAAQAGDASWNYERALKIFKRIEDWQGPADPQYRGRGGEIWVEPSQNPSPLAPAMLDAVKSLGLTVYDDLNGKRERSSGGFALMNHIIKDGRRRNMAVSYLYPVLHQSNITVLTKTHINKIVFNGTTAVGVEIVQGGAVKTIRASNEVVISTGAINTPKLLMLSGVGDAKQLAAHGIKALVDSPEVGQNLQDHILFGGCVWESNQPMELRNSGAEASGFWKSSSDLDTPDINPVQIELPYTSDTVGAQYKPPANSWALCAGLVRPKSRGQVRLRSNKVEDRPVIDARFLSHPDDVAALSHGIELCREIGNSKPLAAFAKREVVPGRKLAKADLENFARDGATTFFHETGTCRMGKDKEAVVDSALRVNGTSRLRIADGSIMPRISSCATMASCVFIGERMSEILGTHR